MPEVKAAFSLAMEAIEYLVARPSNSSDVAHLLAEVFSESEPPAVAMGLSFDEMKQFLELLVPEVIEQGLTVIARSADSGRLAGVMLSDDFALPPTLNPGQISAKLLPILTMLEVLDEQFRRGKDISTGQFVHFFMLGVDNQFAGRGVGQGLVQACVEHGSRKGYQAALTEATGRVSQHIFRKNGFVDRFRVSYREYLYEDKAVFASISGHDAAILMERPLAQAKLQ